ncbi:sulfur carrier protein ThiS [Thaumasiovibrio sp. DFM-14]|uniref:sulfur carrier protein ThiS n=1 Tax=Thaumasiovibrio sp. DFM-14 TaxID=3384792 RepID=UPI0039A1D21B
MTQCMIKVNDKPVLVTEQSTIANLLVQLQMPKGASAVAVNQEIIAREQWATHLLNDGDEIALFQAIAGG